MRLTLLIIGIAILAAGRVDASTNSQSLIQVDSTDFGDTNFFMKIVEVERNANTSKLRLTHQKLGSSVGWSMFICRGFYEVAKARGTEYFINLKEWDDPNGSRVFVAGFTNTKDADLKKEFGEEFDYETDHHQKRGYMSVSQCKMLFERDEKDIEPDAAPEPPPAAAVPESPKP